MSSRRNTKKRRTASFVALPKYLINSSKYQGLRGNSIKLLTQVAEQYNGSNNGDLQASFSVFEAKGWKSSDTFNRAKKELLENGFLVKTRQGHFPKVCSLYGITWQVIDQSNKYDDLSLVGKVLGWWK